MNKKPELKVSSKKYYDVRVESLVPCILHYRILASDEDQAALFVHKHSPVHIKYELNKRKDLKMKIYDAGSCILRLVRNLIKNV